MGYRGKVREREQARRLRAKGYTMLEIAERVRVSKSSVSLWTRDVEFAPRRRPSGRRSRPQQPNALQRRKQAEIEAMNDAGVARIGVLSEQAFLAAGTALYGGDGSKTDGRVSFANSNPAMVAFFTAWLRTFFDIDESRLRVRLYLHQGLDLAAAEAFWSDITKIPRSQFGKAYRAIPDSSIRKAKHIYGCAHVSISCTRTHRQIMGLIRALLDSRCLPG